MKEWNWKEDRQILLTKREKKKMYQQAQSSVYIYRLVTGGKTCLETNFTKANLQQNK